MRAAIALVITLLATWNAGAEDKKKDLDRLQGEWELVSMETGGKAIPLDQISDKKYTLKGDELVPVNTPKDPGKIELNQTKKPAWIDLTDRQKKTMPGIYRIEGDRWEMCFGEPDGPRPSEFKTTAESKTFLMVLQRKSK